jgi:demethoxyubiquinone hydroxylase (CLK1/Coq7/Cat5 family)
VLVSSLYQQAAYAFQVFSGLISVRENMMMTEGLERLKRSKPTPSSLHSALR